MLMCINDLKNNEPSEEYHNLMSLVKNIVPDLTLKTGRSILGTILIIPSWPSELG